MEGTKSFSHEQNGTALTSNLLVRMAQSHPGRSHLHHNDGRLSISALISNMEGTESSHHDKMAQPLHLTSSSEWLWDTSLSLGGSLDMENTKSLSEVLELQPS